MKFNYFYAALLGSAFLMMAGCTKFGHGRHNNDDVKPESEYFSFVTEQGVTLNLNYGALAGNALIEVYDHNPIVSGENEEDEGYSLDSEALYKVFLDNKGCANQKITLPAGVSKVWLYTHNWGVPTIVEANYSNGVISYTNETRAAQSGTAFNTLGETITANLVDKNRHFYTLVGWDSYGKADDFNGIYSEVELDAQWMRNIQNFYWHGMTTKQSKGLDNRMYCPDTKDINIYISPDAKDENGKHIESAQIWVTMLHENATLQNALGYYFYKEGEVPTELEVEKFIIVPNFSVVDYAVKNDPFYVGKDAHVNAPAKAGTKIQLLFKDENGNFTPDFPAGYRIGFFRSKFCWSQGKYTVNVTDGGQNFYSNSEWNGLKSSGNWVKDNGNEGTNHRFSCIRLSDGDFIYGYEDSGDTDWSAEDVTFIVSSNQKNCLSVNSVLTAIDESKETPDAIQSTYKTYAFEDMWPYGGDYDLNDVMVEHESKVTFNYVNGAEYVKGVEDTYTFVQPADAALYKDAFAVQYDPAQRGNITLSEGAIDEPETSSVIVCENVKANLQKSFTITRTFGENSLLRSNLITDLNPFIISEYKEGELDRVEVHMPKHKATSKANQKLINKGDDAYFVDKSGKYPFAITIPKKGFIPSSEKSRISIEYPKFDNWVSASGSESADWYNHCTKEK